MKTAKEWKKEIDGVLVGKASELLKNFQAQRDKGFEELSRLSGQLESFEKSRKELIASQEAETKNFIPQNAILFELARKIHYRDQDIAATVKSIDVLFKKLTDLPQSISEIYPFLKLLS
jgi:hypothetical protein